MNPSFVRRIGSPRALSCAAFRTLGLACAVLIGVGGLATPTPARATPASHAAAKPIARLRVKKSTHQLWALAEDGSVLRTYQVAIGPGGAGRKNREGDLVTPVGRYHVVAHFMTKWKDFMLLDYPNASDRARFEELKKSGVLPKEATIGGQIGIHGSPAKPEYKPNHKASDWTLGCVALDDDEIADLAKRVKDGTPVDIED
jgi:murein L,D-transpeptidase YafK